MGMTMRTQKPLSCDQAACKTGALAKKYQRLHEAVPVAKADMERARVAFQGAEERRDAIQAEPPRQANTSRGEAAERAVRKAREAFNNARSRWMALVHERDTLSAKIAQLAA
jgi:hypothetical protein